MSTVTLLATEPRSKLFRRITTLFRTRPRGHLDARYLSDHFKRDIGLLDGHVPAGVIR